MDDDSFGVEQDLPGRPRGGRVDLVCPDCGAHLQLRVGKFGYFYGCEKYPETQCKGSVSADKWGNATATPANALTRSARREAVGLRAKVFERGRWSRAWEDLLRTPIREMDLEQCQTFILQSHRELGTYDRFLAIEMGVI